MVLGPRESGDPAKAFAYLPSDKQYLMTRRGATTPSSPPPVCFNATQRPSKASAPEILACSHPSSVPFAVPCTQRAREVEGFQAEEVWTPPPHRSHHSSRLSGQGLHCGLPTRWLLMGGTQMMAGP